MRDSLGLDEVRMIPAAVPPLREPPRADANLRLRMLEAALEGERGLSVDRREIEREGQSYTVDTLESLRAELSDRALCLILGMDAFARIERWHRWEAIPALAHICVAKRPGASLPTGRAVAELIASRQVDDPRRLLERSSGYVCIRDIPALEVSATHIRALVAEGRSPRFLLPDPVLRIIEQSGVYRRAQ